MALEVDYYDLQTAQRETERWARGFVEEVARELRRDLAREVDALRAELRSVESTMHARTSHLV